MSTLFSLTPTKTYSPPPLSLPFPSYNPFSETQILNSPTQNPHISPSYTKKNPKTYTNEKREKKNTVVGKGLKGPKHTKRPQENNITKESDESDSIIINSDNNNQTLPPISVVMNLTTAARELFGIEVEIPVGTIFSNYLDYELATNKKAKPNHSRQYDEEKSTSTVTLAPEKSREAKVESKGKPVTLSVSEKPNQDAVSTTSQSTNNNRILSEDFNDESEEEGDDEEEGEGERGENEEEKESERENEKRKAVNGNSKKRAREGKAKSKTKKSAVRKVASESKNGAREGEEDVNSNNHSNGSNSGEEDFLVPNARKPSAAAHPKNKKAVPHVFVIGPNFKRRVFEYKCKICGLKCIGSHMLANHMGRVHPKKNKK